MNANKVYLSYNQLHKIICRTVERTNLVDRFSPTLLIAISAGGFLPARILRSLIKTTTGAKSLPIQTIGLCLYESDKHQIYKTQWLATDREKDPLAVSFSGQHVLLIDEVDETRTTLSYAVTELEKDIAKQRELSQVKNEEWVEPRLGVFVVHNKMITKSGQLPQSIMDNFYFVGENVSGEWIVYPWDALDIDEQTRVAEKDSTTNGLTGLDKESD